MGFLFVLFVLLLKKGEKNYHLFGMLGFSSLCCAEPPCYLLGCCSTQWQRTWHISILCVNAVSEIGNCLRLHFKKTKKQKVKTVLQKEIYSSLYTL